MKEQFEFEEGQIEFEEGQIEDIAEVLANSSPNEVAFVLQRLAAGKITGSWEVNKDTGCGCLLGTIGMARLGLSSKQAVLDAQDQILDKVDDLRGEVGIRLYRPAEEAFFGISEGDTPKNNPDAAALDALMREIALSNRVFGPRKMWL